MKKTFLLVILVLSAACSVFAQEITGRWQGVLDVQVTKLTVVFNISKNGSGFVTTLDSPDQGAKGIPTDYTNFENNTLTLRVKAISGEYVGTLKDASTFEGTFKQGATSFPLNLKRTDDVVTEKAAVVRRPQEPKPPFPYKSEEVKFQNVPASISLAGTLTLPPNGNNFPAVILITGSGPQNRDEELFGHKSFFVIADYLTRKGIAVLRYDDRGVGGSGGDFAKSTSQDFAGDVESAIAYLKTRPEINKKKIGLIGHSEGGIIAPMVAAKSKNVAFIVLLAGSGVSGDEVLLSQTKAIAQSANLSTDQIANAEKINKGAYEIVKKGLNQQETEKQLFEYFSSIPVMKDKSALKAKELSSPWMMYFIRYNPAPTLAKVKCPILALNGEKDVQVLPKLNLPAIQENLAKGGNKQVTIKEIPKLNHLFQECTTCSTGEYKNLEETFSPAVLVEISSWIQKQTK